MKSLSSLHESIIGRIANRILLALFAAITCFPPAFAQSSTQAKHEEPTLYGPLARAPQSARQRQNPFEGNPQEATAGGKLFEQHCAECHGEKAGGTRRAPALLTPDVQQAAPGTLFWLLTNGSIRRGMPVWSKLPEPQRWQIVTFLQSLNLKAKKSTGE